MIADTFLRMQRVGLVLGTRELSSVSRKEFYAAQTFMAQQPNEPEVKKSDIGFPYPKNGRK